ncbi:60S ribosomal protein L18a-like protein [Raphanus sativus]|uniref:60S ribosomal protein L18a-like protein n=1 Tax=Raphanus sativus TaxID=3726 RepID=A0A9W3CWC4_RAPSA|nr:60S ribosomal protein L18a-like protein [Raphanus sativus]
MSHSCSSLKQKQEEESMHLHHFLLFNISGYSLFSVYGIAEGRPVHVRQRRLPCCGIGLGWFLFIVGFFLGAIPWYVGMFIMIVGRRIDHREKPGYIACTIAAILATIAVVLGVTKGAEDW